MAKSIIKEIIIILLLCLAIILILGVLLYEYVPGNQLIPEKVSYVTSENVKEALNKSEEVDTTQVILTYEVDSTDLNNYRRIKNYVPGKKNPFSTYAQEVEEGTEDGDKVTNSSGTTSTQNGTSSSTTSESEGKLFNDKGTK